MKCALCIRDYINAVEDAPDDDRRNMARVNALANVHAAETTIDGTAVCIEHLPTVWNAR